MEKIQAVRMQRLRYGSLGHYGSLSFAGPLPKKERLERREKESKGWKTKGKERKGKENNGWERNSGKEGKDRKPVRDIEERTMRGTGRKESGEEGKRERK